MLVGLSIRDVVLIDRLDLQFGPGLWALTGETGAGKSIVLDALGLATGARADRGLVRQGCDQSVVTAEFDVPPDHPVWAQLTQSGLAADSELILRRIQNSDGRSRAFINDQPVSIALLAEVGQTLLEIHGQRDDRGLLDTASHRALLDAFGRLEAMALETSGHYAAWREAQQALEAARAALAKDAGDEEYLRHVIDELEQLNPKAHEEEELSSARALLMNAEKISDDLDEAARDLSADGGLETRLSGALRRLELAAQKAPGVLDRPIAALDRALIEVQEAIGAVQQTRDDNPYDQDRLENLEERLFALRAVARKHSVAVSALPELLETCRGKLSGIERGQDNLDALEQAVAKARDAYFSKARSLSQKRSAAAKKLDKSVAKELKPLKLEKAQFKTAIEPLPDDKVGSHGQDRVQFMVSTNPGAPLGPLTQIASGGELARFILALKVALAGDNRHTAMIFDEVDRGVGGAVSDAVGERLSRLAQDGQVLVVTHSPQVAARADRHLRVEKRTRKGRGTLTSIVHLSEQDREEEIARMLSAAEITDEARAAAASLLRSGLAKPKKTATAG